VREESLAGLDADVTFEVTGAQGGLIAAGEATRMSGKLAIVGYHQGEPRAIPLGHWNWMALQILNAHIRDVATIMRGMRTGMRRRHAGRADGAAALGARPRGPGEQRVRPAVRARLEPRIEPSTGWWRSTACSSRTS
jgi:hypothetical protein